MSVTNKSQVVQATDGMQKAVFELLFWQNGNSNFTSMLYALIAKADVNDRNKLWVCYSDEVEAFLEWEKTENKDDFFAKYGIKKVAKQEVNSEQSA